MSLRVRNACPETSGNAATACYTEPSAYRNDKEGCHDDASKSGVMVSPSNHGAVGSFTCK